MSAGRNQALVAHPLNSPEKPKKRFGGRVQENGPEEDPQFQSGNPATLSDRRWHVGAGAGGLPQEKSVRGASPVAPLRTRGRKQGPGLRGAAIRVIPRKDQKTTPVLLEVRL